MGNTIKVKIKTFTFHKDNVTMSHLPKLMLKTKKKHLVLNLRYNSTQICNAHLACMKTTLESILAILASCILAIPSNSKQQAFAFHMYKKSRYAMFQFYDNKNDEL